MATNQVNQVDKKDDIFASKLDAIAAKVKQDMELVREGNTFYLVLNKPWYNDFDNDYVMKMSKLLDEVEAADTKGEPACLVTFSSTRKCFSSGFSVPYLAGSFVDEITSQANMQKFVLAKILKLSMPTMAIIRGKAYAAGLVIALCHDMRIMTDDPKARLILSDMTVGRIIPPVYNLILRGTLPIQTAREIAFSVEMNAKQALKKKVVMQLCANGSEVDKALDHFIKTFGPKAWNREVLGEIKSRMYREILTTCDELAFGPMDIHFNGY